LSKNVQKREEERESKEILLKFGKNIRKKELLKILKEKKGKMDINKIKFEKKSIFSERAHLHFSTAFSSKFLYP